MAQGSPVHPQGGHGDRDAQARQIVKKGFSAQS